MAQTSNALQADRTKFSWRRVDTTDVARIAAPPTGGLPDFTMSPVAVSKMPTTGLALMLQAPTSAGVIAATPNAGGFGFFVWVRDPATGLWASFAEVTIAYQQLFVTFDIDASDLFFQLDAATVAVAGFIYIGIAEQ